MAETTLTIRVDEDLKDEFARVAADGERTAAQYLRHLMRQEVEASRSRDAHDDWFRDAVGEGLADLDSGAPTLPHDEVASRWSERREALESRLRT